MPDWVFLNGQWRQTDETHTDPTLAEKETTRSEPSLLEWAVTAFPSLRGPARSTAGRQSDEDLALCERMRLVQAVAAVRKAKGEGDE
jgi:hypothetical protein